MAVITWGHYAKDVYPLSIPYANGPPVWHNQHLHFKTFVVGNRADMGVPGVSGFWFLISISITLKAIGKPWHQKVTNSNRERHKQRHIKEITPNIKREKKAASQWYHISEKAHPQHLAISSNYVEFFFPQLRRYILAACHLLLIRPQNMTCENISSKSHDNWYLQFLSAFFVPSLIFNFSFNES